MHRGLWTRYFLFTFFTIRNESKWDRFLSPSRESNMYWAMLCLCEYLCSWWEIEIFETGMIERDEDRVDTSKNELAERIYTSNKYSASECMRKFNSSTNKLMLKNNYSMLFIVAMPPIYTAERIPGTAEKTNTTACETFISGFSFHSANNKMLEIDFQGKNEHTQPGNSWIYEQNYRHTHTHTHLKTMKCVNQENL